MVPNYYHCVWWDTITTPGTLIPVTYNPVSDKNRIHINFNNIADMYHNISTTPLTVTMTVPCHVYAVNNMHHNEDMDTDKDAGDVFYFNGTYSQAWPGNAVHTLYIRFTPI